MVTGLQQSVIEDRPYDAWTTEVNASVTPTVPCARKYEDRLSSFTQAKFKHVFLRKINKWHIINFYKADWGIFRRMDKTRLISSAAAEYFAGLGFSELNS